MKRVCVLLDGTISADSRAQRTVRTMSRHADVDVFFVPRNEKDSLVNLRVGNNVRLLPVHRVPTRMDWYLRHSFFFLEMDFLVKSVEAAGERYDLVYVHDLPISHAALKIARRDGARILYDVHDLTIETINQGFPSDPPFHKAIKYAIAKWVMRTSGTWWARRFVPQAGLVVTPNAILDEYQRVRFGARRTMTLPNYPEYREVERTERLFEDCGIPRGSRIALYHGLMGRGRFLRRIVASAEHLAEGNVLVMVGGGHLLPELKEIASGPRFKGKIYFHDYVPYEELLPLASAASLGLILIDHINLSKKYALANKLTEYMASGVAVLGSDSPENRRILTDADAGYLFQVTTAEALGARMNELLANPAELAAKGRNGQKAFRERYNWQAWEPAFEKAFLELLGGAVIAIVDYGMGNLASIANMLKRIGIPASITSDPAAIAAADRLILPGVGAFDAGMRNLRERGLVEVLERRARGDRVPLLGICLGLQLLARSSEEGSLPGLGWLDATVVRFRGEGLKVPHVGWNTVRPARPGGLFEGAGEEPRFYFVHAYHLRVDREADVLGTTVHGAPFPSAVAAGNLLGVQFHPEKSHRFGMTLLRNFAKADAPPC